MQPTEHHIRSTGFRIRTFVYAFLRVGERFGVDNAGTNLVVPVQWCHWSTTQRCKAQNKRERGRRPWARRPGNGETVWTVLLLVLDKTYTTGCVHFFYLHGGLFHSGRSWMSNPSLKLIISVCSLDKFSTRAATSLTNVPTGWPKLHPWFVITRIQRQHTYECTCFICAI